MAEPTSPAPRASHRCAGNAIGNSTGIPSAGVGSAPAQSPREGVWRRRGKCVKCGGLRLAHTQGDLGEGRGESGDREHRRGHSHPLKAPEARAAPTGQGAQSGTALPGSSAQRPQPSGCAAGGQARWRARAPGPRPKLPGTRRPRPRPRGAPSESEALKRTLGVKGLKGKKNVKPTWLPRSRSGELFAGLPATGVALSRGSPPRRAARARASSPCLD